MSPSKSFSLVAAAILSLALHAQTPSDAALPAAAQDSLLAAMHRYADQYVSNLPNFLCMQVTRELESGLKSERWRTRDTFVSRLSFSEGNEKRALDSVNGKPFEPGRSRFRTPPTLTTEGEFGILLSQVLGKESQAVYSWNRWETVRGKRQAVFDFSVDQEHSTLRLQRSDLAHATLAYHGAIFADPDTGAVWRIFDIASDIPRDLETREISTTVDYGEVAIGERRYLLPIQASVSALLPDKKVRHDMEFQQYRKFAADSSVTFDANP